MTDEEIIADERYYTCGRCRWGDLSFFITLPKKEAEK